MPLFEAKPLPALLTAIILVGMRQPVIRPVACNLESQEPIFRLLSGPASDNMSSSGTETSTPHGGVSKEQVRR